MTKPIVYVDLDGTLSPSDVLLECCLLLLKKNLFYGFLMVYWALKGPWVFKTEIAKRIDPVLDYLPIDAVVLERLNQLKSAGHELVLASASLSRDVKKIADRLGLFDRIIASEHSNLKGVNKLNAIEVDSQGRPFLYFGDAAVDIPVWEKAAVAYGVNTSTKTRNKAMAAGVELSRIDSRQSGIRVWLKAMRLQQWAKNSLLFLPLIAAHELDQKLWLNMLVGFIAFGLVASATYIWNDLMDLNADRQHPRKKHRPMACGDLSISKAFVLMKVLGVLGFTAAFVALGWQFTFVLFIYTVVTLLYTFVFKRTAIVDVVLLAMLYTVRVIAGGVGAELEMSSWLLAISLFVFLSLALVKRCAELEFLQIEGSQPQGRGYRMSDLSYLVSMGISSGFVAVLVLALYVDSQNGTEKYSTPEYLWGICPIFLYWLMRIWILTSRKEMIDDPVHFAIHDRISWGFLGAVGVLVFMAA
ncbi:UbiA family prenyltransferase [Limnobacter parvus]|uniref:UbiA family prenyltransferase n=1 Tax=Limnobacter parvus TaxID=2939690 RepID=A0ABT1XJ56_9BURK|nr:UbiA family prenyltransferase [Limnobacter parvus]MCR2746312.1 UbiA family prenyltransferase [Limnobacter parvus]